MGKPRGASRSNSKKPQNGPREVTPEVFHDKKAANQLSFDRPTYAGVSKNNKARDRAIARHKLVPKKKERVYSEKELGIPKLNTSLDPVGVKVKGKKGKKFVNDTSMQLILAEVQQNTNAAHASRLEKARQLEAIREVRRKEMEEKEQRESEKLSMKKKQLKKKGSKKVAEAMVEKKEPKPTKGRKRVSFA